MNQIEKDEILKKVGSVLQFCHDIVSRLSSPCCSSSSTSASIELNNNIKRSNHQQRSNRGDKKYSDVEEDVEDLDNDFQEEELSQDEVGDKIEDDLWWDSNYPPLQFYTLVYDDDLSSLYNYDDTSKEYDSMPSDMSEDMLIQSLTSEDMLIQSPTLEDELIQLPMLEDVSMQPPMSDNVLMDSVLKFLDAEIPDAIYDPNWREERKKKAVHPEFYTLWTNFYLIFTDEKDDDDIPEMPTPENIYHTIDLYNVNARFINNIPKPNRYPVLGVSNDPDFYHQWYQTGDPYKRSQKFLEPAPFGSEYGYETNLGIVLPPKDPIHGYIWSEQYGGTFVLHAVKPGDAQTPRSRRRRA